MNEVFENTKCTSTGTVIKLADKWSYIIRLHVLPTDDVLEAEGPLFNNAKDAAMALLSVYGQRSSDLINEVYK